MLGMLDDQPFVGDVLRVLGENSELRQEVQILKADKQQLELQLMSLQREDAEFFPEAENTIPEEDLLDDKKIGDNGNVGGLMGDVLRVLNTNSLLRGQIQLMKTEISMLKLAAAGKLYELELDLELEEPCDNTNGMLEDVKPVISNVNKQWEKKPIRFCDDDSSEGSSTGSPKIKAVRGTPRSSCSNSSYHAKKNPKIPKRQSPPKRHTNPQAQSTSHRKKSTSTANRKKGWAKSSAFMGSRRAVAVDAVSQSFFASLRS